MKQRTVLFAEPDKIITDGKNFGKQFFLADGETGEKYYEITTEEYSEMMKDSEEENV